MNESLRQALFNARLTEQDIAAHLNVDPKTVRRWLTGRLPYPRHRWDLSQLLAKDEADLWPELRAVRAAKSRPAEIAALYPRRSSITQDGWYSLFDSAEHTIDILVYSGLFLAENADLLKLLMHKATKGVQIRMALGDPDSPHVAERGDEEAIGDAMAAKIRNALVLYRPLQTVRGVQLHLHDSILYNSIYRADDQILVNQHMFGVPASHAPVYHLRRAGGGEMFERYRESFGRIWATSRPVPLVGRV